ncbi:MAG: GNAT family N-acetyltransferase [Lachnospiraceae bacterium]|nr:GNAT family N-acetyltransferase [Lachnospiraceae bacterium]
MRYLILVLKDYSYPFLDRMLADVKLSGIRVISFLSAGGRLIADEGPGGADALEAAVEDDLNKHAFILTDCSAGIDMAHRYDTGYVFYEADPSGISGSAGDENDERPDASDACCIIQGFDETGAGFYIKMFERFHHLPWTILKTERLILREMTVDDVDRLYEIYSGPGITDFTEPLYEDRQREVEYTKDYIRNMYEFCGYGLWIVAERDGDKEGRIVGRAGITGREGYDEAELGYVIEASRQRRGYATEACSAIVEYARDVLYMKGLNCFVYPGNEASVKLCKLLGFEYIEDVLISGSDMLRYHLSL